MAPMRKWIFVLLCGVLVIGSATACRRGPKSVPHLIGELRHPQAKHRRSAADDLRMDNGVPQEAIGPLLEAAGVERDPGALGAMLITLGRSGVPEAKPYIDGQIPSRDKDMRRWASRALRYWFIATGEVPENYDFPRDWPYGQPGYPPRLHEDDDDDD